MNISPLINKNALAKKVDIDYQLFMRRVKGIGTFSKTESKKIAKVLKDLSKEYAEVKEFDFIKD